MGAARSATVLARIVRPYPGILVLVLLGCSLSEPNGGTHHPATVVSRSIRVLKPPGATEASGAWAYPVGKAIMVEWEPGDQMLTIELNHREKLLKKIRSVKSGATLDPGISKGAVEVKFWIEGRNIAEGSLWVFVE